MRKKLRINTVLVMRIRPTYKHTAISDTKTSEYRNISLSEFEQAVEKFRKHYFVEIASMELSKEGTP